MVLTMVLLPSWSRLLLLASLSAWVTPSPPRPQSSPKLTAARKPNGCTPTPSWPQIFPLFLIHVAYHQDWILWGKREKNTTAFVCFCYNYNNEGKGSFKPKLISYLQTRNPGCVSTPRSVPCSAFACWSWGLRRFWAETATSLGHCFCLFATELPPAQSFSRQIDWVPWAQV